jgi:kumamolisin
MGGTSAVAPMWAALTARINQQIGVPIGLCAPLFYRQPAGPFRPVTEGGNDRYRAGAPWNPCTGLGIPDGKAITSALRAPSA